MSAKILKNSDLSRYFLNLQGKLALLFILACSHPSAAQTLQRLPMLSIGEPMPAFSMKSNIGKDWTTDDLKGKVTVLSFWYIGSGPGMEELRYLNLLLDSIAHKDFQALSFARNTQEEIANFLTDSSKDYTLTKEVFNVSIPKFEVIPACHYIFQRQNDGCAYLTDSLGILAYPTTLLLDKTGKVRVIKHGFPVPEEPGKDNKPFPDAITRDYFNFWRKEAERLLAE